MTELGIRENPHIVAPEGYGCPDSSKDYYGHYCKCSHCGFVARTSFMYDFYADPGQPFKCETCLIGTPKAVAIHIDNSWDEIESKYE